MSQIKRSKQRNKNINKDDARTYQIEQCINAKGLVLIREKRRLEAELERIDRAIDKLYCIPDIEDRLRNTEDEIGRKISTYDDDDDVKTDNKHIKKSSKIDKIIKSRDREREELYAIRARRKEQELIADKIALCKSKLHDDAYNNKIQSLSDDSSYSEHADDSDEDSYISSDEEPALIGVIKNNKPIRPLKYKDNTIMDRTTDRTNDRTTDRTTDRTNDRTTDMTTDKTTDKTTGKTTDRKKHVSRSKYVKPSLPVRK